MHSFDRFYVVTQFILPTIRDSKFVTISFDETCNYLQEKNGGSVEARQYISDLNSLLQKDSSIHILL